MRAAPPRKDCAEAAFALIFLRRVIAAMRRQPSMAWIEYYRNRFPYRAAKAGLDELIRPSLETARPLIDELAGGNTTCKILSGRRCERNG
jgi:hypothetical protein